MTPRETHHTPHSALAACFWCCLRQCDIGDTLLHARSAKARPYYSSTLWISGVDVLTREFRGNLPAIAAQSQQDLSGRAEVRGGQPSSARPDPHLRRGGMSSSGEGRSSCMELWNQSSAFGKRSAVRETGPKKSSHNLLCSRTSRGSHIPRKRLNPWALPQAARAARSRVGSMASTKRPPKSFGLSSQN